MAYNPRANPINFDTRIQSYIWTEGKNELPLYLSCGVCKTLTKIMDKTKNVEHKCENVDCTIKHVLI